MAADEALSLSLPCSTEAPGLARAALSRLPGIDPVRDDALLIVSELVANAVCHSGSRPSDDITLRVSRTQGRVTISVRDAGRSAEAPHLRDDGAEGDGGFGLVIVQRLAQRWDSRANGGRTVWAELSVPPVPERAADAVR